MARMNRKAPKGHGRPVGTDQAATPPRPLLALADNALADDMLRVAAAAGCDVDRLGDVDTPPSRSRWSDAPLVVLDATTAITCANAGLPRRDGVILLVTGPPEPHIWQRAVAVGAEHVVTVPDGESWLVGALAEAVEAGPEHGRVLAVAGGRGGAGASVLATAVAVVASRRGHHVLLVDCDPLGGGLDVLLGVEEAEGLRWSDLALGQGRVTASSLHAAAPRAVGADGRTGVLTVLSAARDGTGPAPTSVGAVCGAGRRAGDIVVCDVPRWPDAAGGAALRSADLTVLVVPAQVRAATAALAVLATTVADIAPVQLVVRGPAPGGVRAVDLARMLDLPLLTAMRPQPNLIEATDRGTPPGGDRGPLAGAAATVLDELTSTSLGGRAA